MRLHHIGIVVKSLEKSGEEYARSLHLEPRTGIIFDPLQQVRLQFWALPGDATVIELIEPAGPESPARRALEKGGGLNHLCYEVPDIEAAVAQAREQGALQTREILSAVAFDGRRVAFVYYRLLGLIEFLEAERTPSREK